jgi:hypothetical protein
MTEPRLTGHEDMEVLHSTIREAFASLRWELREMERRLKRDLTIRFGIMIISAIVNVVIVKFLIIFTF